MYLCKGGEPEWLRPEPEVKPKYTILSKSVASWFLEHKHVYISEATIQAATEAAETVARHHIKLPPLDFSTIDLGACRAALKAKQEAEKMVQLQMNNAPKKEEGEANPHAKSYQLLSSLGPSLETWMARISPVLPISSPTREQQAHDMPLRRTSLAGSIAASSGMPSPSRFNPALASTRAHRASSNGQPQGHGPVRCSVNGAPVRQSGLSGPPRQSMSGAPRQSMCGGTSAVQYGIDGLPTGPSRKVSESGSINERVRHSSNRQEGSINHRTLTIETFFEADGPYPFDVQRARASRLPSYQTCAGLDLDAIAAPHSREVMRCGVSLAFLQYFSAFVENSNDTSVWTTRHVVEKFVKPRTKKTVCRYCDTLPDGVAGNPRFLVSHRWDSIFSNMVKQVSTHFKGQDPERIFLFIDIFSLKQHKKEETSTDQATLTMLKDVVTNVQQTLIVLDRDGLVLRRVWVLYEAWLTLIAHPSLPRCVCVLGFGIQWSPLLQELVCTLDIMKAEASNSGDLALILKDMKEGSTGGMGAANRFPNSHTFLLKVGEGGSECQCC
ncbi:hypothetical protein CEUSTIGMA_g8170.t1 [Chlamydomonas eustigma]|uniref:Uncharacterized protein n=1 Tax=Chlamydomonas eustigma TaxID=1157962 RepID=A0A250XCB5_9CHLO|nr:hypothetical protein CEUSTIGMA_g8170.t1 [Chlamydomonas eustigma]|eukprot:GAX80735.1 hypothetical protein CEUSTIGMA_g8170.t1 [Chlamydomonas eustigma]